MEKELREYIDKYYIVDSVNGQLYSKIYKRGKPLGSLGQAGYVKFTFSRFGTHIAHRILWEYVNGDIPKDKEIDHISRDKLDNRLCNLRLSTTNQNRWNTKEHSDKQYGVIYKGVCKSRNRYRVSIQPNGVVIHGGMFKNQTLAALRYNQLSLEYFGKFAYLNVIPLRHMVQNYRKMGTVYHNIPDTQTQCKMLTI